MTYRGTIRRATPFLLAAALLTGVLTTCGTALTEAASCEGTESGLEALRSHGILDSRPRGAIVPKGFENLDAGCWEDSGEAWLYAERTYVFPGDKADVIRHYRTAAEGEGWKPSAAAGLCFTLGRQSETTKLDVYFLTEELLKEEEPEPGPEFDSGTGYQVTVTATADGSATDCEA